MIFKIRSIFLLLGLGAIAGCNWFDSSNSPIPVVDLEPSAEIVFPTRGGFTPAESIVIRGVASDDDAVSSVTVNGVVASSTDGFATWTATLPLTYGDNTVSVDVTDNGGNQVTAVDTLAIERRTEIRRPFGAEFDSASNTLYYVDIDLFKILALDLATGDVNEFLDLGQFKPNVDGSRPPLDLALDLANDRVFLTVRHSDVAVAGEASVGIWVYDMVAQTWSAFSDSTIDPSAVMTNPSDVYLDAANSRLLVLDFDLDAVVAVNLSNGAQSIFSSNTVPNNVVAEFVEPIDAVLDSVNNRLLVIDRGSDTMFSVSLIDGSRTLITGGGTGSGESLIQPLSITLDAANSRALTFDRGSRRPIVAIDLASGARTQFAEGTADPDGLLVIDNRSLAISGNELIVLDNVYDHALAFDLASAERRLISNNGFPRASNDPALYTFEKIGEDFLGHLFSAIGRIDANNNVEILADNINVRMAAFDATGDTAYIVDSIFINNANEYRIQSVDLETGVATMLSDNSTPNTANPIQRPVSLALSDDGATLYLLELDRITVIDAQSGARSILANDGNLPYTTPDELKFDSANNRLLLSDYGYAHLIAIDPSTGARTIIADTPVAGETDLEFVETMMVADNGDIYIMDRLDRLVKVDAQSGARTVLIDVSILGSAYPPYWEWLVPGGEVIYAKTYEGIVEIDPTTGAFLMVVGTPVSAPGNAT